MNPKVAGAFLSLCLCTGLFCLAAFAQKPELVVETGHADYAWSISISPDGHTLASGGGDNTIKLWEVDSGRELRTLSGHTKLIDSVAFSPDGHTLASGSLDNTVRLWDGSESTSELRSAVAATTITRVKCSMFPITDRRINSL